MFRRNTKSGFTLVEILIVVIILGILAAIVIPQFTNASQDARKSSLVSQLQTLRTQIQLYKLQHGDVLPDLITSWAPLTTATTYNGISYGPYLQADPKNALNGEFTVIDSAGSTQPTPNVASACGFVYDYAAGATGATGRIWATDETAGHIHSFIEP